MIRDAALTDFDQAVLFALVAGDTTQARTLQTQVRVASVIQRKIHGEAGYEIELAVPDDAPKVKEPADFEIEDVRAVIVGMLRPISFVLFVSRGRLIRLKATLYDEPLPTDIQYFDLEYLRVPRLNPILEFGARRQLGIRFGH